MKATPRALIVNADDFGQRACITRGIIEAHEHGIVTSASMMVCWPDSTAAAAYARSHPSLSLGLHVDIGEWTFRNGGWTSLYTWVDRDDPAQIAREAGLQLERFRDLLGRDPTHVDSHQHVHRRTPVRDALARIADELGVPLRHFSPAIRHCGDFYGQSATGEPLPDRITSAALAAVLRRLPAGITELVCHPGACADDIDSMYRAERYLELLTLCDGEIRDVLAEERITLMSFGDVFALNAGAHVSIAGGTPALG